MNKRKKKLLKSMEVAKGLLKNFIDKFKNAYCTLVGPSCD